MVASRKPVRVASASRSVLNVVLAITAAVISSYALALIGFHRAEIAQSGGRLVLAAVPSNGMRAIELAGLETHIEIHASVDEAVRALST